jgi:hypothetical protein
MFSGFPAFTNFAASAGQCNISITGEGVIYGLGGSFYETDQTIWRI